MKILLLIIIIVIIIAEIITRIRTLATIIKGTQSVMIVVIMVLETTTAPQLNSILQSLERSEVAIGVGQRAADCRIVA